MVLQAILMTSLTSQFLFIDESVKMKEQLEYSDN